MQPTLVKIFLSLLYDLIIQIAIWFIVSFLLLLISDEIEKNKIFYHQISFWITSGFYFIFSWLKFGQTIGMKAWNLKLVSPERQFSFFLKRYLLATIGLFLFGLGFLIIFIKKKFLHDILLNSKIIYVQSE